jgi:hypothetical protein
MTSERPMFPQHQRQDVWRSAFFNLEDEVHDLDRMAELADDLVRAYVDSELIEPHRERQGELALCMLAILRDKTRDFRAKYLASFPSNRTAG